MSSNRLALFVGGLSLAVSACGVETIVNRVDERGANRILELLEENQISVTKGMIDTGREQYFTIAVSTRDRLAAIKLLNRHEMPPKVASGYDTVFETGGLIPTQAEERAKYFQALEGEIQKQLMLIPGILDVEVQINIPPETALKTQDAQSPATASVTIKYLTGTGGSKPLSEPQVQGIVAAGVEKLTPDHVVVAMVPGELSKTKVEAGPAGPRKKWYKQRDAQIAMAAAIAVLLIMGIVLVFTQIRLKNVRGRLIRLQNEIAKARRKPGGEGATA